MQIKTTGGHQYVRFLSGGNQQKIVLAKWLALDPKVLILDEPTRGIDIGAREQIYRIMDGLARKGVAVLFVSSDLEELIGMADRVLVFHEGELAGEVTGNEITEQAIMSLATGTAEPASVENR
jgi:ribose transport system ATP-binding protein